jgi:AraC family transcriptional regulator
MATRAEVVLPRRGVFVVDRHQESTAVDTNTILVLGREEAYRVSHPVEGGDDTTVFVYSPELLLTALGSDKGRVGAFRPADQLASFQVRRNLASDAATMLEREEQCMLLLRRLANALGATRDSVRLGPAQRLRVRRTQILLASEPARPWSLDLVSRAVESSPFHLARQFRSLTGETISRYLLRLRLGAAMQRLAEGEDDLMKLACELGFAHHSHFTARFRAAFGVTPSAARATLTGERVRGRMQI